MGLSSIQAIVAALRVAGMAPQTPVAVVCSAHTPAQRQVVCTLASLVGTLAREGLVSPAIVVVGDVVRASPLWSQPAATARSPGPVQRGTVAGRPRGHVVT